MFIQDNQIKRSEFFLVKTKVDFFIKTLDSKEQFFNNVEFNRTASSETINALMTTLIDLKGSDKFIT